MTKAQANVPAAMYTLWRWSRWMEIGICMPNSLSFSIGSTLVIVSATNSSNANKIFALIFIFFFTHPRGFNLNFLYVPLLFHYSNYIFFFTFYLLQHVYVYILFVLSVNKIFRNLMEIRDFPSTVSTVKRILFRTSSPEKTMKRKRR